MSAGARTLKTDLSGLTEAQAELVSLNAQYQSEKEALDAVATSKLSACEGEIYNKFIEEYNRTVGAELENGIQIIKRFAETIGLSEEELNNATQTALKSMGY